MFGALHIEMAFLSTLGDWVDNSGWTTLIFNAKVARSGVAQSLLSGKEVDRTKYAHEVTVSVLHNLMHDAYNKATENEENPMDFDAWRIMMEEKNPNFQFWSITYDMERYFFLFRRSIRTGNFQLYQKSLINLLPWFFALDHYHYARWLTIHAYDMSVLNETSPSVFEAFSKEGRFVVSRTRNPFSSIGIDHCHEQLNKSVKGDGGAVGLTEDEDKFLRWMVCGPEVARVVSDFEDASVLQKSDPDKFLHHDQTKGFQEKFSKHVKNLMSEFEKLGNPFVCEESNELIQLDTRDVKDQSVVEAVKTAKQIGKSQLQNFLKERLLTREKDISATIKKNKLPLFSSETNTRSNRAKNEKKDLKKDVKMFAQHYVATQVRGGDMEELFSYETRRDPPALAKNGEIRGGDKADLLTCLKDVVKTTNEIPDVDASVLEGSVIVNMTKPGKEKTFGTYAENLIVPKVVSELDRCERVDVVFDTYRKDSLKSTTRRRRGKGIRRKVEENSQPPKDWDSFLRIDENKTELFRFLSHAIKNAVGSDTDHIVVCAYDNTAIVNREFDMSHVSPCSHEEADTRVFLHLKDVSLQGYRKAMIRTVDTDVLIIAIALFSRLGIEQLWVDFGVGKNREYYSVHDLFNQLGEKKARGLLFFHAFTGCDQVSFFSHCKKKNAWNLWQRFDEISDVFVMLSEMPTKHQVSDSLPMIERFVSLMYKRTTNCEKVNDLRRELFVKDGRDIEKIPPTMAALKQHVLRAVFMAGYTWFQSLVPCPEVPPPQEYGWTLIDGEYLPHWTDLPEASLGIRELMKCGCNPELGCCNRCKCVNADFLCTELCKCNGDCERE